MNAPGGNTISTAEHAFSLLLCAARKIPQADAMVRSGKWDRKEFEGVELYNKTLGIIGMGRIGSELSRRAIAFGMRVLAFDPYLSATRARALAGRAGRRSRRICSRRGFHHPAHAAHAGDASPARCRAAGENETRRAHHQLRARRTHRRSGAGRGAPERAGRRGGARCFRNGTAPGRFTAARNLPNLVLTPHLGASTAEAQESVGIEIAQSIRAALLEGTIRNAVNMPNLDAKTLAIIGPHLRFGEKLGRFLSQLAPKRVEHLNINYSGKVNEVDTTAITRSVLKGFLQNAGGSEVNEVNAPAFAESLGMKIDRDALERGRRLHRSARTLRRRRRENGFGGRRILRRDAAHREREQPPGGSATARRRAGAGKHRSSGHRRADRHACSAITASTLRPCR